MDRRKKPSAISPGNAGPQPSVRVEKGTVNAVLPTGDSVEILLYGASVISWKSNGKENLWLSKAAKLDGSKAVRGGIPVVFPVCSCSVVEMSDTAANGLENSEEVLMRGQCFGPPPKDHATAKLPQHGFARTSQWEYLGKSSSESGSLSKGGDDSVTLDFGLSSGQLGAEAMKAWPYEFGLVYSVTLGKGRLQTMLRVSNQGKESFEFQMLLHSYFRVDVSATTTLQSPTYRPMNAKRTGRM